MRKKFPFVAPTNHRKHERSEFKIILVLLMGGLWECSGFFPPLGEKKTEYSTRSGTEVPTLAIANGQTVMQCHCIDIRGTKLDLVYHGWRTNGPTDKNLPIKYNPGMTTLRKKKQCVPRETKIFPAVVPKPPCEVCATFVDLETGRLVGRPDVRGLINLSWEEKRDAEWNHHLKTSSYHNPKKTHTGNGKYMGPYAFTLTMSPKDQLTVGDMLIAVRKVMTQQSCPVRK